MLRVVLFAFGMLTATLALSQPVSFKDEAGSTHQAERKGGGEHAIVFVHGQAGPSGWEKWPDQAAARGYLVLVLHNQTFEPRAVLAAARHARTLGARAVSLIGASRGGQLIGVAAAQDDFAKVVYVSPAGVGNHAAVRGDKLMIISRGERDAHWMNQDFEKLAEPKRRLLADSASHGHALVREKPELLSTILDFIGK